MGHNANDCLVPCMICNKPGHKAKNCKWKLEKFTVLLNGCDLEDIKILEVNEVCQEILTEFENL